GRCLARRRSDGGCRASARIAGVRSPAGCAGLRGALALRLETHSNEQSGSSDIHGAEQRGVFHDTAQTNAGADADRLRRGCVGGGYADRSAAERSHANRTSRDEVRATTVGSAGGHTSTAGCGAAVAGERVAVGGAND